MVFNRLADTIGEAEKGYQLATAITYILISAGNI